MPQLDPAIYSLLGSLIGGGIVVFGQWIGRRQETHRALTEFAVKTAIENWRQVAERADMLKMPRHEFGPSAMDGYLIRTLALVEILQRRKFTPRDIADRLAEMESIGLALAEHLNKQHAKQPTKTA